MTAPAASPAASVAPPVRDPDLRRKFQLTEFGSNHNKHWQVEAWDLGGDRLFVRCTWGRVGDKPQQADKLLSRPALDAKIAEKVGKGYREIDLHVPQVSLLDPAGTPLPAPARPASVLQVLDWIFQEAGERIASYLATTIDALSRDQIARGRRLLADMVAAHARWQQGQAAPHFDALADLVEQYYNAIPTQLPRNLRDVPSVVRDLCSDFHEQEDRLDQLEAALATRSGAPQTGVVAPDPYARLGTEIAPLPAESPEYRSLSQFLAGGSPHHPFRIRVRDIFTVEIPSERAAFAAHSAGIAPRALLTHGTPNPNVRHILHDRGPGSGLRLPRSAAHGWMFGPGIYFADIPTKSAQYCRAGKAGVPRMLFLTEVAVGKIYVPGSADSSLRQPPRGFHSVRGTVGQTGGLLHNEYIVYHQAQQTIRYLVTFDQTSR